MNPTFISFFLSIACQSVSGPALDVFIKSVVKAGEIKRGADVCSCRPDYGVEWMVGEPAEFVCMGSFERVTAGSGGGRRGGVGSYDLKEPFL